MLNAGANQAFEQKIAKLEREIKDIETSIDPTTAHTGQKVIEYGKISFVGGIGMLAGYAAATYFTAGGALIVSGITGASGLATSILGYITGDTDLTKRRKSGIKKINSMSGDLLNAKFDLLTNAVPGSVIDFVFNREPTIKFEAQEPSDIEKPSNKKGTKNKVNDKTIEPVSFNPKFKSKLLSSLRKQDGEKRKIKIRKIDISNAELNSRDLKDMLTAGLGNFNTEQLSLRSNLHTEQAIKILKEHIVDKGAFQSLKTLDLSGNKLEGACLEDLAQIVNHLRLKKLILSDNTTLGGKLEHNNLVVGSEKPMQDFLKDTKPRMTSLKKVGLRNTGLQEVQADQLSKFLKKSIQLEKLDLSENEELSYAVFVEYINKKGIAENISLQEIVTDHDEYLEADNILEARDVAFKQCEENKSKGTTWALHLINYVLANHKLPRTVSSYLSNKYFNEDKIKKIVGAITKAREDHLGIKKGGKTQISERELFSYYNKDLPELYKQVREKKIKQGIDDALIKEIDDMKVKTTKTPRGKINPLLAQQRPGDVSQKPEKRQDKEVKPLGKRPPKTKKTAKNESIKGNSFLPNFTQQKNVSLRTEIEETLGKKSPLKTNQQSGRFRF